MSIIAKLENEMKISLKAGEKDRLAAIRLIKTAVKNKEIELMKELSEQEFFQVLSTQVKQRKESIEQYEKANRLELAEQEKKELVVIQSFLPQPVSNEEALEIIKQAIDETGASSMKDMGLVMGKIKPTLTGRIEGKVLADLVKQSLS